LQKRFTKKKRGKKRVSELSRVDCSELQDFGLKLADAQVLHLLSSEHSGIDDLIDGMKKHLTSRSLKLTTEIPSNLQSENDVFLIGEKTIGVVSKRNGSDEVYSITPKRRIILKDCVEALSEIVLIMQLDFKH
jgi:hypothetical protein